MAELLSPGSIQPELEQITFVQDAYKLKFSLVQLLLIEAAIFGGSQSLCGLDMKPRVVFWICWFMDPVNERKGVQSGKSNHVLCYTLVQCGLIWSCKIPIFRTCMNYFHTSLILDKSKQSFVENLFDFF